MSDVPRDRIGDASSEGRRDDEIQKWKAGVMNPKDQARQWLAERSGRNVHVETRFVDSTATPLINTGLLRSQRTTDPEVGEDPKDAY